MSNWTEADLAAYRARRVPRHEPEALHETFEAPERRPSPRCPVEQRAVAVTPPPAGGKPANKYGAQPTIGPSPVGRMVFDSKLGARFAETLERERSIGGIAGWAPEVSLIYGLLEENGVVKKMRHRVDAMVILEVYEDGKALIQLWDAKGKDLPAGRAKRAAVSSVYGLNIKITKTGTP